MAGLAWLSLARKRPRTELAVGQPCMLMPISFPDFSPTLTARTSPSWVQLARTASPPSIWLIPCPLHIVPVLPPIPSPWRAKPKGSDLVRGRRVPAFSDRGLILYRARSEICGRGSSIYWESWNSSPPRTKLDPCSFPVPEPVFRPSRMGVERSNQELG